MRDRPPPDLKRDHFVGRAAVIATKHGKERSLSLPLRWGLGVSVRPTTSLDTDLLGTFSGEVPRPGSPAEVVVRKAQMGCETEGVTLGLASEGSFGPHPSAPFAVVHQELLACVDLLHEITVIEPAVTTETNFASVTTSDISRLLERPHGRSSFLERVQFPSHALIVMPASGQAIAPFKGIRDGVTLARAIAAASCASDDQLARVESDMRAHMNPTRRRVIRRLGYQLIRRMMTACPGCSAPGWGAAALMYGLPCRVCQTPTGEARALVYRCARCDYQAEHPREDGRVAAEPRDCSFCNP